jgi:hypothetical protein
MRAARRIRLVVALAAAAGARWATAAPPTFHAVPEVGVVQAAVGSAGSGTIVLHNDGTAPVIAAGITAEPGCSASVHASPLGGFMVAPGATHSLAIACSAAPAGIRRCDYTVRGSSGNVLAAFEAACASAGSASLTADAQAIDLGTVGVGSSASRTVALQNTGAAPITRLFIDTTELAGNFAVAAPCNPDARECDAAVAAVPAGGMVKLTVACTPRTPGPQTAQLHVVTDAGTRLAAPIALSCTGAAASAPVISVSPGPIDVGAVELVAATAATTVHITNAGSDLLKLLDVQIVDAGTGAAADWSYTASSPCSSHIPPGCNLTGETGPSGQQTVDLDLVFDPSAIGVRDATLLVNYHDTADRSLSVPLRGVGTGATLDLVGGHTTLDFGTLPVGATAALTFQVANNGTRDLTDGVLAVMPAGPFTASPGPGVTVAAGARTSITVTCKLTAAGAATADLQLSSPGVQTPPISLALRCAADPAVALTATPPAVLLGEVRIGPPVVAPFAVASLGGPTALTAAVLETVNPALMVSGAPATTPAMIALTAAPRADGNLADRVLVSPASGPQLAVVVTGTAVTARYNVPGAISLGTFCVEQPTTPRIIPLASTDTATITVLAPALQRSDSPFDLEPVAPQLYPAALAPLRSALIAATPKRQAIAGLVTDDLVWTTDVADEMTAHTTLSATFINNGGALAPHDLDFDTALIHLDTHNAQQVTLRNCDVSALQLDPPVIPAPFTIDSPNFPAQLLPGETATFSIGFHPTRTGPVTKMLTITSPQLSGAPLTVNLTGIGIALGSGSDAGPISNGFERTSFYACGSCASGDASGTLVFAVAVLCVVIPRRRR